VRVATWLGLLLAAGLGAAIVSKPPPVKVAPAARPVEVESFDRRWAPVNQMPPAVIIRRVPNDTSAAAPTPPPALKIDGPKTQRRSDICARHGLRRVTLKGGRSWRCRR
jgi:hypothetical protein